MSVVPIPTSAPPPVNVFAPNDHAGVDTVNRIVAVVGKTAITWSEMVAAVYNYVAATNQPVPRDAEGQYKLGQAVLTDLVNQELLVQKAPDIGIEVTDADVAPQAEARLKQVRSHFATDAEYRSELEKAGLGSPQEYRRSTYDQARRQLLQQKVIQEMGKSAKPGSVTEEEVDSAYARMKDRWANIPAMTTFRQIVIAPKPSKEEDARAKAKAESLLVKLRAGADFAEMAKKESMDPGSRDEGGDLGWNRRGSNFVPEFEAAMFNLRPGEISNLVKTSFGYHIIKVDRVRPAEVKVRHILIAPEMDSADVERARRLADSVATAWRNGAKTDELVTKFHDPAEEKAVLQPFPIDSLPPAYKPVVESLQPDQISAPFELRAPSGAVKFAILQLITKTAKGEFSEKDARSTLRRQLSEEKQIAAILDTLREQTYVSIRFGPPA
jgi:peptidyl-prolyl cis-trans isomerase SurA